MIRQVAIVRALVRFSGAFEEVGAGLRELIAGFDPAVLKEAGLSLEATSTAKPGKPDACVKCGSKSLFDNTRLGDDDRVMACLDCEYEMRFPDDDPLA